MSLAVWDREIYFSGMKMTGRSRTSKSLETHTSIKDIESNARLIDAEVLRSIEVRLLRFE